MCGYLFTDYEIPVSQQYLRLLVPSFPRLSYWITANFAAFVLVCPLIPVCRARPSLSRSPQSVPPSTSVYRTRPNIPPSPQCIVLL